MRCHRQPLTTPAFLSAEAADPAQAASSSFPAASTNLRPLRGATFLFVSLFSAWLFVAGAAPAATITVNTAADNTIAGDGECTLREALINSNGDTDSTSGDCVQGSGPDEIHFNIPGAGPHVISISGNGRLPEITAPVIIDGATQPGNGSVCASSIPDRPTYQVVLEDAALISSGVRFVAGSDGSTIRGLNIRGFDDEQIDIVNASTINIACNFLGSDETGTSQAAGNGNAITVFNGSNIFVGGSGPGSGNLLTAASSGSSGVSLTSAGANNSILYNFIGTDKMGAAALPNEFGILYFPQTGGQTQENFKISNNLISGNAFAGVAFDNVDGLEIRRNLIGTDLTGTLPLGNGAQGIVAGFANSATGPITIGGAGASDGNTIAFNGADGILVNDSPTSILGNSVFSNDGQGIDLGNDGPDINDGGDGDSGVNNLQNSPFLLAATAGSGGTLEVTYLVDSVPDNSAYPLRVEFFKADADGEEGMTYLGFDEYTVEQYFGCSAFPCAKAASVTLVGAFSGGDEVVATATDSGGNTSEFSAPVIDIDAAECLRVTTDADSGPGSLRQAILCANADEDLDTITFAIPGEGPHVIRLESLLPRLGFATIIDGSTQPGNEGVCTEAIPDRPDYQIVIDGGGTSERILDLRDLQGSTLRGLNIRGALDSGIVINASGDTSHTIECNFIGTDETGLLANGHATGLFIANTRNVTVGGPDPGQGNLISGNADNGIFLFGDPTIDPVILGNFIGTDKTGAAPLGNGGAGVRMEFRTGTVSIGGTSEGEGNVIAYNAVGVLDLSDNVGHTIRGNSIFANTGLGIDLSPGNGAVADGVTANDPGDADVGSNQFQNFPRLLDATVTGGVLSIGYRVDSTTANSAYPLILDFYVADGDGEEGALYVGSATYEAADAQSPVRVSFIDPGTVAAGDLLVATATDSGGNTSEFSAATEVNAYLVSTTADDGLGSLRQAITNANATTGENWITFAIPGDGPHVIAPVSLLPVFAEPVILDGTTQPGNETVCTDAIADRAPYQIVLEGDADGAGLLSFGLAAVTGASGSIYQGLNIRNFGGDAIFLSNSSDNTIRCNFIGTDADGTTAVGNEVGAFVDGGQKNRIGGPEMGDGNLISGHGFGVGFASSSAIFVRFAVDTVVQGNTLGADKSGLIDLGNGAAVQVLSPSGTAVPTRVGGTAEGEGNTIAFNDNGVVVSEAASQVTIQGNRVYGNKDLGIDLLEDGKFGRTPNDLRDSDVTANPAVGGDGNGNQGQNFPVMSADVSTGDLMVTFSIDTAPTNATYPLTAEFFLTDETGAQGETPIGMAEYTESDYSSGCSEVPCEVTVVLGAIDELGLAVGDRMVATATDDDGNTSEFSDPALVEGLVDLEVSIFESTDPVLAGSGPGNLVYFAFVFNEGDSVASDIVLETALTLPEGVEVESLMPTGGTLSGTTWTLGTLEPGEGASLIITLTVGPLATAGVDTVAASLVVTSVNEPDVVDSNDSASESTSVESGIDLAVRVSETAAISEVLLGGDLVYEIALINNGIDVPDAVVTETVPANTTFDAASSDGGWQCLPDSAPGSTCTFEIGALGGGEATSLNFAVTVDSVLSRDVTEIVNGVFIGTEAGIADATPADNTDEISTSVDLPPIVEAVDTVASTADGELRDGEGVRVPVTQILLEFSEEVTGAGEADSFLLLEAGADGVFSSTCAGGVSGDDLAIIAEATVYDESDLHDGPTTRLELGAGLPFGQGRYRVLACGEEIEDAAGQRLDGDGDGAISGDFGLDFAVSESSRIENPNFDQALSPWSSLDFVHDSDDVDGAPSSGSAEVLPRPVAVLTHPCLEIDTVEAGFFASMAALIQDPGGATPSLQIELEFFADSECQGAGLGTESLARVEGATGSEWLQPSEWRAIPETAQSVRPSIRYEASDASGSAFLDRVSLIPMLFGDGFESGTTDAWTMVNAGSAGEEP